MGQLQQEELGMSEEDSGGGDHALLLALTGSASVSPSNQLFGFRRMEDGVKKP